MTEIGEIAFYGCDSLSYFEYPKALKLKKGKVFEGLDLKKIKFVARKPSAPPSE